MGFFIRLTFALLMVGATAAELENPAPEYTPEQHYHNQYLIKKAMVPHNIRHREIKRGRISACAGGNDCCRSWNRCGAGEGDCDSDSECLGDFVCGENNCGQIAIDVGAATNDTVAQYMKEQGFSPTDDCCYLVPELAEYARYVWRLKERMGEPAVERMFLKMFRDHGFQ